MKWLDKLMGKQEAPRYDASVEELVAESQELGRQIDMLRDRRRLIRHKVEARLAALQPKDAVVSGQVLDVKVK
jgi:hypothetical protein